MAYALCITFGILLLFLIFAAWGMLDKDERNKKNEAERKMFKEVIKAID